MQKTKIERGEMKRSQKHSAKVAETIFPHNSEMRSSYVVVVVVVGTLSEQVWWQQQQL